MQYTFVIPLFIVLPLVALVAMSFFKNKEEDAIFWTTFVAITLHSLSALLVTSEWLVEGAEPFHYEALHLYDTATSHFSINFYFDFYTVAFGAVMCMITFMVALFSRYYMHREKGYKRFFINLLLFFLGINVIIFSGNFETLFIGWEIIGITSFFLIAFYNDRYLPVKNSLKVVSNYRIADILLLLAIWAGHHAMGKSIDFYDLSAIAAATHSSHAPGLLIWFLPIALLIVTSVKSAQFPFSSWLPRAMEGPTTSSAIFYGSLSVHMGVFLMIRTFPLWEENMIFRIFMALMGIVTTIVTTGIARVQSSAKTQIAYSSIAQIGLMFVWVALGWHWFATLHFMANAFLRTYQLLVSPSILSYLIHDQFFNFIQPQQNFTKGFLGKLKMSLYILSIREFLLDDIMYRFLWAPLKKVGNWISYIPPYVVYFGIIPLYFVGLYLVYHKDLLDASILGYLPYLYSCLGIVIAMRAFVQRQQPVKAWVMIFLNNLFTSLTIGLNEQFDFTQIHIFLSGIMISGIVGVAVLLHLKKSVPELTLNTFFGYQRIKPVHAFIFLIASLGLMGFPITPSFIGEDLILGHIHENQYGLTALIAISLIIDGLAVFRMYARIFLGPYKYSNHEVAFRSS